MLAKFPEVESIKPYLRLEKDKKKKNFCVVFTYSIKRAHEIKNNGMRFPCNRKRIDRFVSTPPF